MSNGIKSPDHVKCELPINLNALGKEYEPFLAGLFVPEDTNDPEQKDLPYDEYFLLQKKRNPYLETLTVQREKVKASEKQEKKIIEKLEQEGKLSKDRDRAIYLEKHGNRSFETVYRLKGIDKGKEFLQCICGGRPVVIKGRSVGNVRGQETYSVYCQRCHVSTIFQARLDYARRLWNAHAIYGAINKYAWKDYNYYVFGQGRPLMQDNGYKAKITGAEKYANAMELFFMYDMLYEEKIHNMLEEGMSFKNYQDLCNYLGEYPEVNYRERLGQSGKYIAHNKWWRRFFDFERIGHKIIIRKIYKIYAPWSGDKEFPNRGRKISAYRPRLVGEKESGGWGSAIKNYTPLPRKYYKDINAKISAKQIELAAAKQVKKEKQMKGKDQYLEEDEREEYEIYEDDDFEYFIDYEKYNVAEDNVAEDQNETVVTEEESMKGEEILENVDDNNF